eukprot:62867-Chlamydomonas_euryale.AAC.1
MRRCPSPPPPDLATWPRLQTHLKRVVCQLVAHEELHGELSQAVDRVHRNGKVGVAADGDEKVGQHGPDAAPHQADARHVGARDADGAREREDARRRRVAQLLQADRTQRAHKRHRRLARQRCAARVQVSKVARLERGHHLGDSSRGCR